MAYNFATYGKEYLKINANKVLSRKFPIWQSLITGWYSFMIIILFSFQSVTEEVFLVFFIHDKCGREYKLRL